MPSITSPGKSQRKIGTRECQRRNAGWERAMGRRTKDDVLAVAPGCRIGQDEELDKGKANGKWSMIGKGGWRDGGNC